jgi:hemin uptake protein HemP
MFDPPSARSTRLVQAETIRFRPAHRPAPVITEANRPVHDARDLTAGIGQAEILLDGVRYILRITRQGKLILTN